MKKTRQQHDARTLFMRGESQKQIAYKLGVTEKTVSKWAQIGSWREVRAATHSGRSKISLAILEKIDEETQKDNCDADKVAKLSASLDKIGARPGLPLVMEVFMAFNDWLLDANPEFTKQLIEYEDTYFNQYNRAH